MTEAEAPALRRDVNTSQEVRWRTLHPAQQARYRAPLAPDSAQHGRERSRIRDPARAGPCLDPRVRRAQTQPGGGAPVPLPGFHFLRSTEPGLPCPPGGSADTSPQAGACVGRNSSHTARQMRSMAKVRLFAFGDCGSPISADGPCKKHRLSSPEPPVTELPAALHFLTRRHPACDRVCDAQGHEADEVSQGWTGKSEKGRSREG